MGTRPPPLLNETQERLFLGWFDPDVVCVNQQAVVARQIRRSERVERIGIDQLHLPARQNGFQILEPVGRSMMAIVAEKENTQRHGIGSGPGRWQCGLENAEKQSTHEWHPELFGKRIHGMALNIEDRNYPPPGSNSIKKPSQHGLAKFVPGLPNEGFSSAKEAAPRFSVPSVSSVLIFPAHSPTRVFLNTEASETTEVF